MKKLFLFSLFMACMAMAGAQNAYYVFFESQGSQPFYVKLGDKLYSGDNGFLTIPNLSDSSYNFRVGAVSGQSHEALFSITLNGKDRGFIVKPTDDGLQLADIQSNSLIKPDGANSSDVVAYQRRNDVFSTLLAKASDDSGLLWVPVYTKTDVAGKKHHAPSVREEKTDKETATTEPAIKEGWQTSKADTTQTVAMADHGSGQASLKADSAIAQKSTPDTLLAATTDVNVQKKNTPEKAESSATGTAALPSDTLATAAVEPSYQRSTVKKHSESSTTEGFGLVYYDTYNGNTDTIRLVIPNPKFVFKDQEAGTPTDAKQAPASDNKQFLNFTDAKDSAAAPARNNETKAALRDQQTAKTDNKPQQDSAAAQAPQLNSATARKTASCRSQASDGDFLKVRRDMAAKFDNEEMIAEAKKYFKNKCFTTEQIRYLSTLFLTPEGKYRFFDAAYQHVSDVDQFASLAAEIKDEYYLRRFKALIGE